MAGDEGLELVGADLDLAGDHRTRPRRGHGCGGGGGRPPRSAPSPPPDARAWRSSRRRRAAGRGPAGRRSSPGCRRPRRGRGASRRPARGTPSRAGRGAPRSTSSAFSFIATSSLRRQVGGLDAVLPAGGVEAPREHAEEAAVVVDHGKTDCAVVRGSSLSACPRTRRRPFRRPHGQRPMVVRARTRTGVHRTFTRKFSVFSRAATLARRRLEPTRDPLSRAARGSSLPRAARLLLSDQVAVVTPVATRPRTSRPSAIR